MLKATCCFFTGTKMARIVRSSLPCEAVAICQGVDQSIWHQYYLFGILTSQFRKDVSTPMDQLPLLNPYLVGKEKTNLLKDLASEETGLEDKEIWVQLIGKDPDAVFKVDENSC